MNYARMILPIKMMQTIPTFKAPRLTLINYKVDNISKYVCLTVIIDITRKITKFVNFLCVIMTS